MLASDPTHHDYVGGHVERLLLLEVSDQLGPDEVTDLIEHELLDLIEADHFAFVDEAAQIKHDPRINTKENTP